MIRFRVYLLLACLLPILAPVAFGSTLRWNDNSDNEDGFRIERRDGKGMEFVEIATVGPDVETYKDESALPGRRYVYRVQAFNAEGGSGWTNEAQRGVREKPKAKTGGARSVRSAR